MKSALMEHEEALDKLRKANPDYSANMWEAISMDILSAACRDPRISLEEFVQQKEKRKAYAEEIYKAKNPATDVENSRGADEED